MPVFDLKNATLVIKDGSTNSLEIKLGDGTCTFSETLIREYIMNRGKLYSVRNGDEAPVDLSFSFLWEYLKGDTGNPPSVRDVLYKEGNASNWVSTDSDPCTPYCVDLVMTLDQPCAEDKSEVYTFSDFRHEKLDFDAKANSVNCSGKCNITRVSIARV